MSQPLPVIIVGAGPAGIGCAALLSECEVPAIVLERGRIGESFHRWPEETRFISPSFTGNFFGAVDLNAITPYSSPAFGFQTEHPSGAQYALYLQDIVEHYALDIQSEVDVQSIDVGDNGIITLTTSKDTFRCYNLIWAGGEFQHPKHIPHTVRVASSYGEFPVGNHVIIGGSESGIEAAYHLVKNGSHVTVIDPTSPWKERLTDSSYGLSPYTFDRVRFLLSSGKAELVSETATTITADHVITDTQTFQLEHPAIDATGFDMSQGLAKTLFDFEDGYPRLTEHDESTKYDNVFLVGPNVKHDNALFCFIYKYRQRFAVIAREILSRIGEESDAIESYANQGFLLDDLSCCDQECTC